MTLLSLHPKDLVPGNNVRDDLGDLSELTDSIASVGVLEPLLVRQVEVNGETFYEIVAGHRRQAAAIRAGAETVPVVVGTFTDAQADETMLIENLMRKDLSPVEEAKGYFRLVERGMDAATLAARLGRSVDTVTERLALLELEDEVLALITTGELSLVNAGYLVEAKTKGVRQELLLVLADKALAGRNIEREAKEALRQEKLLAAADKIRAASEKKGVPVFIQDWFNPSPTGFAHLSGNIYHSNAEVVRIDPDAHKAEPCRAIFLNLRNTWEGKPKPILVCTDPARHRKGGSSLLQEPVRGKSSRSEEEKAAVAQARAEAAEDRAALAHLATSITARDLTPLLLPVLLGGLAYQELIDVTKVLGLEVLKDVNASGKGVANYYKTMEVELAKGATAQRRVAACTILLRADSWGLREPFKAQVRDRLGAIRDALLGSAAEPALGPSA